jgi:mono/diheme cytochrome c family protein
MSFVKALIVLVVVGLLCGIVFVYSGIYNVAADEPHSKFVFALMDTVRERSVATHAKGIEVPPLDDPGAVLAGGADYNEMCAGCHLQPGVDDSEVRDAMYPQPPNLTQVKRADAAQTFWIIKHGMKMSGMPAWGATHDDARIWAMVAFLQQLPRLSPDQYQILTARGGSEASHHSHHGAGHMGTPDDRDADAAVDHHHPDEIDDTPAAAVDRFLHALASGDSAEAQRWLAADVLVYESGHAETSRDAYVTQHMNSDMEFLASAKTDQLSRTSHGDDDVAWVTSSVRTRGPGSVTPVDVVTTETMVLTREPAGWRIRHIHWSSANVKP